MPIQGRLRLNWRVSHFGLEFGNNQDAFDEWHKIQSHHLAQHLETKNLIKFMNNDHYKPEAIACKLLNTFLHQLMKYNECKHTWCYLHLVIDNKAFDNLKRLKNTYKSINAISSTLSKNPYELTYNEYMAFQNHMLTFMNEKKEKCDMDVSLDSRIKLNQILWA